MVLLGGSSMKVKHFTTQHSLSTCLSTKTNQLNQCAALHNRLSCGQPSTLQLSAVRCWQHVPLALRGELHNHTGHNFRLTTTVTWLKQPRQLS